MAWVAVHKNGEESIFECEPKRTRTNNYWVDEQFFGEGYYDSDISLPKGSIKKLIGRDLTWEDEPVELMEE